MFFTFFFFFLNELVKSPSLSFFILCLECDSNGWNFRSHFEPGGSLENGKYTQRKPRVGKASQSLARRRILIILDRISRLLWKKWYKNSNVNKIKIYSAMIHQKRKLHVTTTWSLFVNAPRRLEETTYLLWFGVKMMPLCSSLLIMLFRFTVFLLAVCLPSQLSKHPCNSLLP